MLKNIFDSHSPKRLLNQIELLDQEKSEQQTKIAELILGNLDALKDSQVADKITSIAIILNLLITLKNDDKSNTIFITDCEKRLSTIFSESLSESNKAHFNTLIQEKNDAHIRLLGLLIENSDYANQIIQYLKTNSDAMQDIVLHSQSEMCINLAIGEIKDINLLKQLEKELRLKNKKTLKLIQAKIEKIETYEKAKQLLLDKQQHLLLGIEHLASGSYFPLYPAKYQFVSGEWKNLQAHWLEFSANNPAFEIEENFDFNKNNVLQTFEIFSQQCLIKINEAKSDEQALQSVLENERLLNENIAKLIKELVSEEKKVMEFESAFATIQTEHKLFLENHLNSSNEKKTQFNDKLAFLGQLLEYQRSLNSHTNTLSIFSEKTEELKALLASEHKKKKASKETFDSISKAVKSIEKSINNFPLKTFKEQTSEDLPKSLVHLLQLQKEYLNFLNISQAQQHEFQERTNKKFSFLKAELNKKNLAQTHRLFKEIEELIPYCPQNQQANLHKRLVKQKEELAKVEDWYNYATLPKRKEICEAMEALANSKQQQKIKHIQETIKALQAEWKALGQAKDAEGEALWLRFQEAGNKAYEPVQKFFAGKEQQKLNNLKKREDICLALEQYLANELSKSKNEIDWPAAEHFLRMQNKAWIVAIPLPQIHKNLDEKYQQLCTDFENKLEIQRKINLGLKKDLIQQAEKLTQNEDSYQATMQAKTLQENWKKTGYCKEDNELWEEFRKLCDKIFETRNELRQQQQQSENKAVEQAKAICKQLDILSNDSSFSSSKEFESKINQLYAQFEEIKEIPKTRKDVQTQFYQAKKQSQKKLDELLEKSKLQHFEQLDGLYKNLGSLEKTILENKAGNEFSEKLKAVFESIDMEKTEKDIAIENISKLKNISEKGAQELARFTEKQAEQLKRYCIELELEHNIDSPAEDRARRMELQVLRLNKKFNQKDKELTAYEKLLQAYRLGGLYSYQENSLIQRLQTLADKINKS